MKTARVTFSIGVASVALLTACMHTGDKTQGTATQLKAAAPWGTKIEISFVDFIGRTLIDLELVRA